MPLDSSERDDREERAKIAYMAFTGSISTEGIEESTWEELAEFEREAWRCAADAAYRHIIVSKEST